MNWYAKKGSGGQGIVIDEDTGRTVAVAYDEKDAQLLATAPKLLAALESFKFIPDCGGDYCELAINGDGDGNCSHKGYCHWAYQYEQAARSAIAKARKGV